MTIDRHFILVPSLLAACLAVSACSETEVGDNTALDQNAESQQPLDTDNGETTTAPSDDDVTETVESTGDTADGVPATDDAAAPEGNDPAAPEGSDPATTEGGDTGSEGGSDQAEDEASPEGDSGTEVEVGEPSAPGADLSGGEDDSPTVTETLSLQGSFIKDESRSAGPPSAPTGLTRLMAAENWVEFTWAPSSDDQSVEAYEIYRDDQLIATVRGDTGYEHDYRSWLSTSFIDCNFTRYANCVDQNLQPLPGASYSYSVAAVDNEGMRSPRSEPLVMSMATPSQSAVDLSSYTVVFNEDFNDTKLDRSRWKTSLPWGPDDVINNERQYFVNTFGTANPVAYDPFVFTGETLQITAINTPADQLENANGQPYLSGVLTTSDYFEMTYGYVEMSAKLASGEGMLSTFFLFNQDYYKNKPEIDVIEYLGARPDKAYQTYHYYDSNRARFAKGEKHSSPTMETIANQDLSADFHTYGVLWEPELVVWYIDGVEVRRLEGVRVSDEPMNIVTQLVMGSEWIGDPDPAKVPAVVEIDFIRAWQK